MKNSHWKAFEKGMKMEIMFQVKVHYLTIYHILLVEFGELSIEFYALKLITGFQQWHGHLSPSWLVV